MKNNMRHRLPLKIIIFSIICAIVLVTSVPRIRTIWELTERKEKLVEKKIKLEEKSKVLKEELDGLDSRQAIEKIAREQLGMVKDGEKFITPLTNN